MNIPLFPLAGVLMMAASAQAAGPLVSVYPVTPGAVRDRALELTVAGRAVVLETYTVRRKEARGHEGTGRFPELVSSRARFAAAGPAEAVLTLKGGTLARAEMFTSGRRQDLAVAGAEVRASLGGPDHYVVKIWDQAGRERTVFLWVDGYDGLETSWVRPAEAVVDAAKAGIASHPEKDQTRAIQAQLDRLASRPGGGTLYFPAGVYRCGTIRVGSNTTLYLEAGALLKGVDSLAGFPPDKHGQYRHIWINRARNAHLAGRGTVDANGWHLGASSKANVQSVDVTDSQDVTLSDLCFLNALSWSLHLLHSDRVTLRNVKVLSCADGVDPDASRDVLVDRFFCQTGDDALVVKATANSKLLRSCERIRMRDCLVSSIKTALKVGTENRAPIRDVTFERCTVFDSARGIAAWVSDGFDYENITWRDIVMDLDVMPGEDRSGEPFRFLFQNRQGLGNLKNVLVENVRTTLARAGIIRGLPEMPLEGLTLRNITIDVGPNPRGTPVHLFDVGQVRSARVEGMKVNWQGRRAQWAGVFYGELDNLAVTGLAETQ